MPRSLSTICCPGMPGGFSTWGPGSPLPCRDGGRGERCRRWRSMLSVDEARDRVLGSLNQLDVVEVSLTESLGMTLAEEALARDNLPPFDNSAMDGYAVRAGDLRGASQEKPVKLAVLGDIPAGRVAQIGVGEGQAMRIMTGAPLPESADTGVAGESTRGA